MQNPAPLVTIIVPCYNQAQFLGRAFTSILNQGVPQEKLEIIVIDDGSETPVSINFHGFSKDIIHLVRTPNMGLAAARNKGLDQAKGQFVQFLDADDYLLPNKLISQLGLFYKDPNLDVLICDYWIENIWSGNWLTSSGTSIKITDPKNDFLLRWETEISIPIHCALLRRASIDNARFPETLRAKEDWLFWLSLSRKNLSFLCQPDRMAVYVLHSQNMTKQPENILKSFLDAALIVHNDFCLTSIEKSHFFSHVTEVLSRGYLPRLKNSYQVRIQLISALTHRWASFRNSLSSKNRKNAKRIVFVSTILAFLFFFLWLYN